MVCVDEYVPNHYLYSAGTSQAKTGGHEHMDVVGCWNKTDVSITACLKEEC
jgi:hypothetical protein